MQRVAAPVAVRLLMNNGAEISTEAVGERSAASGGNITLHLRDFLFLVSSEISTSVRGRTGSGGDITIDPQFVILNHSSIIAQAIEGHGGNITITAGQFIPSVDSVVSASSELGISGTVVINGPRVDVNGALVVLSSQLRCRTVVLREACAARADGRSRASSRPVAAACRRTQKRACRRSISPAATSNRSPARTLSNRATALPSIRRLD